MRLYAEITMAVEKLLLVYNKGFKCLDIAKKVILILV